jgi:hypothetical protein
MNNQFGSGSLYALPNAGNLAANPTPYVFGVLQEASLEFKGDLKKLFGQNQFPVAKARGKIDVSGKSKAAIFDPNMLNQLFFGQTQASGITQVSVNESGVIPASPFQLTAAQTATFVTDYGVIDASTGANMVKVASAPATGQYSVSGSGVYTFAAADTGKTVKLNYTYTTASTGTTVTLSNQAMGYAPELKMVLWNTFRTKRFGIELNNITIGSIAIATKQEDFWTIDFTFEACTDSADVLGKLFGDIG